MDTLTAIFIHKHTNSPEMHYYSWFLFKDLETGHYHSQTQERDRYVHHLAIL